MPPGRGDGAARRRAGAGRLALVHGFTQTGRSWDPLRSALMASFDVLTPDLPGHGSRSAVRGDLWRAAELLGDECGAASYVGYSMGGRVALHLALARPALVPCLVLVAATPGIADTGERRARRHADEELARSLEDVGVEAFLRSWLGRPLFSGLSAEAAGLDARRQNTAAGLAACLREMGTGAQESLWPRLAELTMPVLVMAGRRDAKFSGLAEQMADRIPDATLALVPDAGHACHLERPDAFLETVVAFLLGHADR